MWKTTTPFIFRETTVGATNYSNVWKNCATCDCWTGERSVNEAGDTVSVDSSAAGICTGFWEGSRKFGNDKCTEWKRWAELGEAATVAKPVWPDV